MKFLRGFLSFIAFLLCIVLFASTLVTMLVADIRVITSRDNLKNIVSQTLFGSYTPAPRPNAFAAAPDIFYAEESEETSELLDSLVESVYEMLADELGSEMSFSLKDVENFVKESTLPDFISEKTADILSDIYNGKLTVTITGEDIKELIEDNKKLIEDVLDIEISSDVIDMVTDWVDKSDVAETFQEQVSLIMGDYVIFDTPSIGDEGIGFDEPEADEGVISDVTTAVTNIKELIETLKDGKEVPLPTILTILRSVTTQNVLIACIGVCVVLMLLIFLCKLDRWYAALRNCGIVFLLAGLLLLLPVGLSVLLPTIVDEKLVVLLIQTMLKMTVPVSGGVAIGGLVMIITGSISGSAVRRCQRKKAAAVAATVYTPVPVAPVVVPVSAPVAPVVAPVVSPVEKPTPAPAPSPAANRCHSCGAELFEGGMFCGICGAPVISEPAEEPAAEEPTPVESVKSCCQHCGAELFAGGMFCGICGAPVISEPAGEPAAEDIPVAEPAIAEPVAAEPVAEEPVAAPVDNPTVVLSDI